MILGLCLGQTKVSPNDVSWNITLMYCSIGWRTPSLRNTVHQDAKQRIFGIFLSNLLEAMSTTAAGRGRGHEQQGHLIKD